MTITGRNDMREHATAVGVMYDPSGSSMAALQVEVEDLRAKVQYLVDYMDGLFTAGVPRMGEYPYKVPLLEDHCFTFPDGQTWYVTGHEPVSFDPTKQGTRRRSSSQL